MNPTNHVAKRLEEMVLRRNREMLIEVVIKAVLGIVFSFLTFGFLFCLGWFCGWLFGRSLHLEPWQFGALVTGLFFVVAVWSAWRQVDPLAGVQPMTNEQWLLTQLSLASSDFTYFSPRHTVAGSAVVLLAGPSSVFEALGLWAHRLRADRALIEEAAELLPKCSDGCPLKRIRVPAAALLLKRLALVKAIPKGGSSALTLTEKGSKLLTKAMSKKGKQPETAEDGTDSHGPSLPLDLAQRGWRPHRFPESNIVVFLPESMTADFDAEGVLLGSTNSNDSEFSATLHRDFERDRTDAFDFVAHLARQKHRKLKEVGTYRFFFDPTDVDVAATANRFWVIGIPGAVVVVSLLCNGTIPVSEPLREIKKELPHIVGELL